MDRTKLEDFAQRIRIETIKMLATAGSGHTAGPLGLADIFACFYLKILKHRPLEPWWSQRDRLIVSCGHVVPVWYSTLALSGYFPRKELASFRQLNSRLQGHPLRHSVSGVENTAGPLGQGVSVAVGVALAAKIAQKNFQVYCLASDAEQQSGQTWEAVMSAAKFKLNNLKFIIDRNNIQISGRTEEVMPIDPLAAKYQSFNWHVLEIDGHNFEAIENACLNQSDQPTVIIAQTIPGKGVDFMENNFQWHGKVPNQAEAKEAIKQLTELC